MTAILLLQIAAKATLVLLGAFAVTRAMSRASAAARHLVWVLALGAALAVPVLHMAGPVWTVAVLPARAVAATRVTATSAPVPRAATVAPPEEDLAAFAAPSGPRAFDEAPLALAPAAPRQAEEPARSAPPAPLAWGDLVVRVWLAGVALMLARLLSGVLWAALTVRNAAELPDTGWQDSLDEAAMALGLRRRIGLKVSARAAVPMATGLWRAVVLLPISAIDWPEERRRVVLQHELAHVKRRDCLLQALAQVVCAVHWFNPAAHMALRRLRAEQERACDDMVIQVGTDARSYADHLFEIARSFRAGSFPTWVAMSMARPSQLEGRVLAILDEARTRCTPSRRARLALGAATLVVVAPLGALRLAAQAAPAAAAPEPSAAAVASPAPAARPGASGVSQAAARAYASSIDVVHGDVADVHLLDLVPALPLGDAVQAVQLSTLDLSRWREAWPLAEKVIAEAATGVKPLAADIFVRKAPTALAAQGNTAVSDDTRRRVADALMSALNDDNPQVRQEALGALASMRDERAIPGLVRALSDPAPDVRMRALSALVQFDSMPAADGVLTALKDSNADVRELAARHLGSLVSRGQLRDQKYIDAFSGLLKDQNADVREQAVAALGRLRVPAAAAPLTEALRDSSSNVREQAARALANLGNADAVPSIIPLLKDPAKDVREQAALALGSLADPRAIDPLTAALKDAEPAVREQAARALGQIARGQRRGGRPVPVPLPPLPPRVSIDQDRIREIEERARAAADRARDFEFRFRSFEVPDVPPLPPEPPPAPPAPLR